MKRKLISMLLAVAMVASMAVGCGNKSDSSENDSDKTTEASTQSEGGTFVVPITGNGITSPTPYAPYGSDDWLMASAPCFDPLFIVSKNGTRWYLAKSVDPTSDDGCHSQMKLNEGMTWHDGEPITVDDVIYTIDVIKDPVNGATSSCITYDGQTIEVEKVDDLTLNITLQKPFSGFESEFGRLQILPKHVFDGKTNVSELTAEANKGIGSGPFKLKEYNEGESIVYERYDDYYRGQASLDEVVIKFMPDESAQEAALQSGEISMMRLTNQTKLEKYEKDDDYTVYNIPEGRLNYLAFNYQSEIMKNEDARKAICLALNDSEIVKGAYGSEEMASVATNFCSPENLYYNDEMKGYEQNIEEAKKLAKSSGLTEKTLHYIYFQQRPNMKETAQIVQEQLKEIGVTVELEGMDRSAFFPHLFAAWISGSFKEDTSWDLASNGMDQLNADPSTKMTGWKGELVSKGFYVSDKTNELWEKASQAITEEEREKYYKELQVQMNEDYSFYPMANTNYVMVARKEFKGLDEIERVPIFEDYLKITMEQ